MNGLKRRRPYGKNANEAVVERMSVIDHPALGKKALRMASDIASQMGLRAACAARAKFV